YQTLAQQNAISNQQLATQAAKVKSDEGVVEADKAAVRSARINLNFTRIVSPIDGKTGPILIQPGNVIPAASASTASGQHHPDPAHQGFLHAAAEPAGADPEPV